MKYLFSLIICAFSFIAIAQLPNTKIYTLDISKERNKLVFNNLKLVSNKLGYNNQPYFTSDGKYMLYASNNGSGNTDIYRYNFGKKKNERLTKTKEAEYSPRYTNYEDEITCVRVAQDSITQNLYAYNLKGKNGHVYLPDLKTIGYYNWLNGVDVIAFTLPEPFYLTKFNTNSLKGDTITTHPGRCLQVQRGRAFYVDKKDSLDYKLKMIVREHLSNKKNKNVKEDSTIISTLPKQEDFVIMNDGTFLMSNEGKLYAYKGDKKNKSKGWQEIADFNTLGILNCFRLALNADNSKLAFVVYDK
jgi:hypothetical protein